MKRAHDENFSFSPACGSSSESWSSDCLFSSSLNALPKIEAMVERYARYKVEVEGTSCRGASLAGWRSRLTADEYVIEDSEESADHWVLISSMISRSDAMYIRKAPGALWTESHMDYPPNGIMQYNGQTSAHCERLDQPCQRNEP